MWPDMDKFEGKHKSRSRRKTARAKKRGPELSILIALRCPYMRVGNMEDCILSKRSRLIQRYRGTAIIVLPNSLFHKAVLYELERILLVKTVMGEEGTNRNPCTTDVALT